MLKGHTKIILTNVETGEQEIHEDNNLITNAIDKIINISLAMNHSPNSYLLPIATKLLGGIMLFDGELTENVNNIHFPVEAHLVAYADQTTNTSDGHRGSYNVSESGKTDTGFVSVWDFGTSQANGTICAVARTSYFAGANPLRYFDSPTYGITNSGAPVTDPLWHPIRYDGEYLYMIKGNSSTHLMRLARVKIPMLRMGVADYSDVARTYEVIASWSTEVFTYTYYTNRGMLNERAYDVTVYADDPMMYEDGQDGYIYCMFNGVQSGRDTDYAYDLNYFTICYDDESYEKSATVRGNTGTGDYSSQSSGARYPGRVYGHVSNGKYYQLGATRKVIHIIPLNNLAAYTTVRLISDDSPDYVASLMRVCPSKGGVYFYVYHYTETSYEYRNGFVYPDGVYVIPDIAGSYNDRNWSNMRTIDPDLTMWYTGAYNSSSDWVYRGWVANYLGTINNLSSVITKTAAQTMKIVYTLTDVDE